MTDKDPRSTFQEDQEVAQTQAALRDDVAWQHHVRAQEGDLALKTALERRMLAQSKALEGIAGVFALVIFAGCLLTLLWTVGAIVEFFQ